MNEDKTPQDEAYDIPEDATVVTEVPFAWLWSSTPWLGVMALLIYVGFLEEISALVVAVIIMVPRYVGHRKTSYTLTDDRLIYERGGVIATQKYPILITRMQDVRVRHGFFGRTLGYQTVDIMLDNGSVATLSYIPALEDVAGRLKEMMEEAGISPIEDQESDTPPDEGNARGDDQDASDEDLMVPEGDQEKDEDPYEVLGVRPDADSAILKAVYLTRVEQTHPDKPGGSPEAFARVQKAAEELGLV